MVCVRFLAVYVVCNYKHSAQVPLLPLSNMPACPLDTLFKPCQAYQCSKCAQTHATKNEAREHAVTHDQTLQPQLEEWRASTSKKRKRCNRCGQDFTADMIPLAMCGACGKDFKMWQWCDSGGSECYSGGSECDSGRSECNGPVISKLILISNTKHEIGPKPGRRIASPWSHPQ